MDNIGANFESNLNSSNSNSNGFQGNAQQNMDEINRELQEKATLNKAMELKIPYVNIAKTPLNPDFFNEITLKTAKNSRVIPFFKVGKKLRIAVDEVDREETLNLIENLKEKGFEVSINLASKSGIDEALTQFELSQSYKEVKIVEKVKDSNIDTYEKEIEKISELPEKLATLTAEQALNMLNISAMKTKASDIHYEPEKDNVVVRFRIDGILNEVFRLPTDLYKNLINQIKYESKMRINVSNVPQDGRYTFILNKKIIGVRVSSIPTPYGESIVSRFLVGEDKNLEFEDLGFQDNSLVKIKNLIKISQGMILVTGPTGSGKSTTLYAILSKMNTPENKVITLEDPVEYNIVGVTQSQIDEKNDYDFYSGLKTVLRQDPDIIMLGEIRDIKTANTASQAALTGHVLLSTLHTNSAIETIPRLINMGLPAYMVAPSLNTIIAQRLVRKVCTNCVEHRSLSTMELKEFTEVLGNLNEVNKSVDIKIPEQIPVAIGCIKCSHTGYQGRMVLSEIITINSEIKELILNNESTVKMILAARKEGMVTIREDGFIKVSRGFTTIEEVYRVTNIVS